MIIIYMSELGKGGGVEKSGWAGRIINNFYCIMMEYF
jgi:hypothetical protein